MTLSRRNEPYRYAFDPALACLIRLYEINKVPADSKLAEAELMDLSPRGCKIDCALNFRSQLNECKLTLSFRLIEFLELRGTIIWQEQRAHGFRYGIHFEDDHQQQITEALKQYAKERKQPSSAPE